VTKMNRKERPPLSAQYEVTDPHQLAVPFPLPICVFSSRYPTALFETSSLERFPQTSTSWRLFVYSTTIPLLRSCRDLVPSFESTGKKFLYNAHLCVRRIPIVSPDFPFFDFSPFFPRVRFSFKLELPPPKPFRDKPPEHKKPKDATADDNCP